MIAAPQDSDSDGSDELERSYVSKGIDIRTDPDNERSFLTTVQLDVTRRNTMLHEELAIASVFFLSKRPNGASVEK